MNLPKSPTLINLASYVTDEHLRRLYDICAEFRVTHPAHMDALRKLLFLKIANEEGAGIDKLACIISVLEIWRGMNREAQGAPSAQTVSIAAGMINRLNTYLIQIASALDVYNEKDSDRVAGILRAIAELRKQLDNAKARVAEAIADEKREGATIPANVCKAIEAIAKSAGMEAAIPWIDLGKLTAAVDSLRQQSDDLAEKASELRKDNTAWRKTVDALRIDIKQLEERATASRAAAQEKDETLTEREYALRDIGLLFDFDSANSEGTSGQEIYRLVRKNVEALRGDLEKLEETKDAYKRDAQLFQTQRDSSNIRANSLEVDLAEAKRESEYQRKEKEQALANCGALRAEINRQAEKRAELTKRLEGTAQELGDVTRDLERCRLEADARRQEVVALNRTIEDRQARLEKAAADLAEAREKGGRLTRALQTSEEQLTEARAQLQKLAAE